LAIYLIRQKIMNFLQPKQPYTTENSDRIIQWAIVASPSIYPAFRAVTLIVPEVPEFRSSVTCPAEFVTPSVLMPPPETLIVAPLNADPPLVTVKVT
jgi:hypothetical protein